MAEQKSKGVVALTQRKRETSAKSAIATKPVIAAKSDADPEKAESRDALARELADSWGLRPNAQSDDEEDEDELELPLGPAKQHASGTRPRDDKSLESRLDRAKQKRRTVGENPPEISAWSGKDDDDTSGGETLTRSQAASKKKKPKVERLF